MLLVIKYNEASLSDVELSTNRTYVISNDLQGDIYLNCDTNNTINFTVHTSDEHVMFSDIAMEFADLYINGMQVVVDQKYTLPIVISCYDASIAVANSKDEVNKVFAVIAENSKFNKETNQALDAELSELAKLPNQITNIDTLINNATSDVDASNNVRNENPNNKNNFYKKFKSISILRRKLFNNKWIKISAIIGVVIVIVGLLFIISTSWFATNKASTNNGRISITTIMPKLPAKYASLKIQDIGSQRIVSGMVAHKADVDYLKHYFATKLVNVEVQVLEFDQVKLVINMVLNKYNINNLVVYFDDVLGSVAIKGAVDNSENLYNAEIEIYNQLPRLENIDVNHVYQISNIEKDFDSIVKQSDYVNSIAINANYESGVVTINGYLPMFKLKELQQKIAPLQEKYNGVLEIKFNVKNENNALPFQIAEVHMGDTPYIVTDNRTTIYIGGNYMGFTLDSITDTQVRFVGKAPLVINLSDIALTGNN